MKKILVMLAVLFSLTAAHAQTAKELIGKWKLVRWTGADGKDRDIKTYFKTDQVYQVFKEGDEFESINGEKVSKGKWKLSSDNKKLTIKSGIMITDFTMEVFDQNKRVMNSKFGVMEYIKQSS
ncbi:hypothetical protein QTN47_12415 [Danxiaibacter flavus]|uniref:Lipocalin-like domain-containing protein n=1 Tax=Danxiaibacter flavus TaxID=3049108 RepID=A0ABV3ZIG9_9BACT|nr:hypothetical protein QNM32_12420 [Chitinophagaceae bacterium DXS]